MMSVCGVSWEDGDTKAEVTHNTLVLCDTAESDTGSSPASDVSHVDRGRVGLEGDTVVTSLVDKVLCPVSVPRGKTEQTSRLTNGDVVRSVSVQTVGVLQPTLVVLPRLQGSGLRLRTSLNPLTSGLYEVALM
jgi:hypothetical protein